MTAEIQVASVDTRNERRDERLRSADWFDAETWPTMTFESTSVRADLRIDRGDFGVGTGQWAEDVVVGKDVDIEVLVEASHRGT